MIYNHLSQVQVILIKLFIHGLWPSQIQVKLMSFTIH